MNVRDKIPLKLIQFIVLGLGTISLVISQPLASQEKQSIKIDGSSTVYPITQKVVEQYQANQKKTRDIEVEFSGTSGGFDKFCRGETDIPFNLYAPGQDSGTFDYFTEAVVGTAGLSRSDLTASEDDDVLVKGVSQDPNALGYFGLAYYEQRANEMKAVAVDNGKGAVLPSRETVENAQYQPLSRPLFIYVNAVLAQKNEALRKFIDFYLAQASELVTEVGYVPLPEEAYHIDKVTFHKGEVGTVFEGKSQFNLTIPELLRKQARF